MQSKHWVIGNPTFLYRTALMAACCLVAVGGIHCMPDERCDEGYTLDPAVGCVRLDVYSDVEDTAALPLADTIADGFTGDTPGADSGADGGVQDPFATVGKPCTSDDDCKGPTALCVIHALIPAPFCSVVGCTEEPNNCPPGYGCLDVADFGFPGTLCLPESMMP